MKKYNLLIVMVVGLAVTAPAAWAQDHKFGLGIVLGWPTGVSGKVFLNETSALDFDLAYDFYGGGAAFSTDYLFHFADVLTNQTVQMRPYIGGGGALALWDSPGPPPHDGKDDGDVGVAARFTGGLSFMFRAVPIETFVDASPGVWLVPGTSFYFGGVIGARYFF